MRIPMVLAASRIVVPRGTFNSWPSMVADTWPPMYPAASPVAFFPSFGVWLTGARDVSPTTSCLISALIVHL